MDFNDLATVETHDQGAEVNIISPLDRNPTDVFITIMGVDSKEWRSQKKKQTTKIIEAKNAGTMDKLDYDALDAEALAAVTLSWRGITKEGKEFKCTHANALDLYVNSPAISSQLLDFLNERANFTKG